jgi:N-acetylmuramoyl-L-alanine amidase
LANTNEQVFRQKEIGGVNIYHKMGYKGFGYNVMHLEASTSDHGLGCVEDILDIAPECKVYRTGSTILNDGKSITKADCYYDDKTYTIEDFIRQYNIKFITKSTGGKINDSILEKYWQNLIDKYNVVLVSPAGNQGSKGVTTAFPDRVSIIVGAVGLSDKGIINSKYYTGQGGSVDFAYFTGDQEGTSFATPRLLAVMILLCSRFGNKTRNELIEILKILAKDVDISIKTGWGVPILHEDDHIRLGKLVEETVKEGSTMKIIEQLIPKSATGRRPQIPMIPTYITIHSTANPKSTAKNEADNVCDNKPYEKVSFHIVVDEKSAYKVIPLNEIAFHAGDGIDGTGNRKSIGVEICESGDRKKTLLNAVDLIYDLMIECNIDINHIAQHFHWSGKDCPQILRNTNYIKDGLDWNWFISKLKEKIAGSIVDTKEHWAKKNLDSLVKKGIIFSPEAHADLDAPITKGQIFALIDRLSDK